MDESEQWLERAAGRCAAAPYLCRAPCQVRGPGLSGLGSRWLVARARGWRDGCLCARAPSLTSVHDPGWLRAGDMMFDGVIPLG